MPKTKKKISKKTKKRTIQEKCTICFEKKKHKASLFIDNEKACCHTFCFQCIYDWVKQNKITCPMCRATFNKAQSRKRSVTIKTLRKIPMEFVCSMLYSFQVNMNNRQIFEQRLRDLNIEEINLYRRIQHILSNEFYLFLCGIELSPGFEEWFHGLSSIVSNIESL